MSRINKIQQQQQQQQQQHESYSRSEPPLKQMMNLKVLYTLDDNTTYLGRSPKPSLIRVVNIPGSSLRIGAVDLKKCLHIVLQSSPELLSEDYDFSCYSKDISEPDEPYVGHGMISLLKDKKGENLIPGRVCTSFASLLGGSNSNETLEVKLKLLRIYKSNAKRSLPMEKEFDQQQENSGTSSDNEEDSFTAPTGRYYKRVLSKQNQPIKASRTKSLPAATYNKQLQQQQQQQFNNHHHYQQQQQQQQQQPYPYQNQSSNIKKSMPNLSQRMNSIAVMPSNRVVNSSPIADFSIFQEPKRIKLDENGKKKTVCLECGTNDSKTWKVIKKPIKKLQYKTGLLCNDCNATMLRSGISPNGKIADPQSRQAQYSSSPSVPNLNAVDINEIFSAEYDITRFGGPLTDIDPLPQQHQQLTPVDEPPKATRLNTTLIDMEEDKENVQPVSQSNSPNKPISLMVGAKQTEFEKILAESFHEFSVNSPMIDSPSGDVVGNNNKLSNGWLNLLFLHAEEDEHQVKQDTSYNPKKNYAKTPNDNSPDNKERENIASSPPVYTTPFKNDALDKMHTSILTSINDDINSLSNWDGVNKVSPPTSFMGDDDGDEDANLTEDEK